MVRKPYGKVYVLQGFQMVLSQSRPQQISVTDHAER